MPSVRVALDARGAKTGAREFDEASKKVKRGATRAGNSVRKLDRDTKKLGDTAKKVGGLVGGAFVAIGAGIGIRGAISTIADFRSTMSTLEAVTGATGDTLLDLERTARDLGATTRFSATEAGEGLVFLARAGFEAEDAIEALPHTLNLAAAGAIGLGEAADIASNIMGQFGLRAEQTEKIVDTLVNTANSSNTNITQLAEALKLAGPIANSANLSLAQTSAIIGGLGDSGVQASMAGTNLRGVIAALLDPTDKAADAIERLGLNTNQVNPATNNLIDVFTELEIKTLDVGSAVQIFGRRNAAAALLISQNIDKITELSKENETLEGTAKKAADTMSDNLEGSIKALTSTLSEAVLLTDDNGLGGSLRSIVDTTAAAVRIMFNFASAQDKANASAQALVFTLKATGVVIAGIVAFKAAAVFTSIATVIRVATASTKAFNAALASNPIGFAAVAVSTAVSSFLLFNDTVDDSTNHVSEFQSELEEVNSRLSELTREQAKFDRAVSKGLDDRQISSLSRVIGIVESRVTDLTAAMIEGGDEATITYNELRETILQVNEIIGRQQPLQIALGNIDIPNEVAIKRLENLLTLLGRKRSGLQASADAERKAAQAQVDAFVAAEDAKKSLDDQILSLQVQTSLLRQDETQRLLTNETIKAQADLLKLDSSERGKYLRLLRKNVERLTALKKAQKEANEEEKKATDAQKAKAAGQLQLQNLLDNLSRENELVGQSAIEIEISRKQQEALNIAKASGITVSQDTLDQIRLEIESRHELSEIFENERKALEEADALDRQIFQDKKSREKEDKRTRDEAQATLDDFFASLQREKSLIGLNAEEREKELDILELKSLAMEAEIKDVDALIARYTDLRGAIDAARAKEQIAQDLEQQRQRQIEELSSRFAEAFGETLFDIVQEGENAVEAVENLARSIQRIAFEEFVQTPFENALRSIFQAGLGSILPSAKGNAFTSSGVQRFESGGVVSSPSLFTYGNNQVGSVAEVAPEAIMPLKRASNGKLGVEAVGGAGQNVTVNMTVYAQDANSFRKSERQIMNDLRRGIQ